MLKNCLFIRYFFQTVDKAHHNSHSQCATAIIFSPRWSNSYWFKHRPNELTYQTTDQVSQNNCHYLLGIVGPWLGESIFVKTDGAGSTTRSCSKFLQTLGMNDGGTLTWRLCLTMQQTDIAFIHQFCKWGFFYHWQLFFSVYTLNPRFQAF